MSRLRERPIVFSAKKWPRQCWITDEAWCRTLSPQRCGFTKIQPVDPDRQCFLAGVWAGLQVSGGRKPSEMRAYGRFLPPLRTRRICRRAAS